MKKVHSLFLLLLLCLISNVAFNQVLAQTITVNDERKIVTEVAKGILYLEDIQNKFIKNPEGLLISDNFRVFDKEELNFSHTNSAFWIKLNIHSLIDKDIYLEVTNPLLDSLILFEKNDNEIEKMAASGASFPFHSRSLLYTKPNFLLSLKKGQTKEYYLYIKSNFPTKTALQLGSSIAILQHQHKSDIAIGGYMAVMVALLLYNLFIFIATKDCIYLYYTLHVFAVGLLYSTIKGYSFEFLWSVNPSLNYYFPALLSVTRICMLLFVVNFLKIDTHKIHFRLANYIFYTVFILDILLNIFAPYLFSSIVGQIASISLAIYLLFFGLFAWRKGFIAAKYFLLASSMYLIGLIVNILEVSDVLSTNFFTENSCMFGSLAEVLLLAFAIAYRINSITNEREKALALVSIITQEKNNILERQDELLEYKMNEELSLLREIAEESNMISDELNKVFHTLNEQKNIVNLRSDALQHINEQLKGTNVELNETLNLVKEQRDIISLKNQHIVDSLRYAQTIQQAILPLQEEMSNILENQFVIYKPKDIVSGDFYWVNKFNNKIYIAAVDCTGHGVPGAFMSLIGYTGLETIVNKNEIQNPAEILTALHEIVQKSLKQKELNNSDGMDIALCVLESDDENTYSVEFAGAKRPCFLYRKEENNVTEIRGTRQSIGGWSRKQRKPFELHKFKVQKSDCIYLFSDGFADQNDEKGNKFGSEKLRKLLQQIATGSIDKQKKAIRKTLREHQGFEAQRDDILLIGIQI